MRESGQARPPAAQNSTDPATRCRDCRAAPLLVHGACPHGPGRRSSGHKIRTHERLVVLGGHVLQPPWLGEDVLRKCKARGPIKRRHKAVAGVQSVWRRAPRHSRPCPNPPSHPQSLQPQEPVRGQATPRLPRAQLHQRATCLGCVQRNGVCGKHARGVPVHVP